MHGIGVLEKYMMPIGQFVFVVVWLIEKIEKLRAENERLREALAKVQS